MNYYEILEISERASQEVIRMAYKALCKKYHPDVYQGDKNFAEEKMKKINEAYDTLSNETKKRQYDSTLNSQKQYRQTSYTAPKQNSYYQQKQENTPPNIDVLLSRGFIALEHMEWIKANQYFGQVLKLNPGKAEAYLGLLMVDLMVKKRADLKNCTKPFNNNYNYQKAYSLGDDSLKRFLKETIDYINKRDYELKCVHTYLLACSLMNKNTVPSLKDAIAEFEKIRGFKDSAKKIEECYQKIAEINSAILAAQADKGGKEKFLSYIPLAKKIALILVPVLIVSIVVSSVFSKNNLNNINTTDNASNTATSSDITTSNNVLSENNPSSTSKVPSEKENSTTSSKTSSKNSFGDVLTKNPSGNSPTEKTSSKAPVTSKTSSSTNTSTSNNSTSKKPDFFGINNSIFITEGDFEFILTYNPDTSMDVEINEYLGSSSAPTIPKTVKGYAVTSISGFSGCTFLTSLVIPNSVKTKDMYAFNGCTSLTSITIPSSVTCIDDYAFKDCQSLTSITLPNELTAISDYTFYNCTSLKSLIIPNSVKSIDEYAFNGCTSLTSITLPKGLKTISNCAFIDCDSLTSITIPNSVTSIGDYAFRDCDSLVSLTIPNSVKTIGSHSFNDCKRLASVTILDGVTTIGSDAFSSCDALEKVTMPNTVKTIGHGAFRYCELLTSVSIPNSVSTIDKYAFHCCKSLISITIPDSVTTIGECAFQYCDNLETVYFKSKAQKEKFKDCFDSTVQLIVQ